MTGYQFVIPTIDRSPVLPLVSRVIPLFPGVQIRVHLLALASESADDTLTLSSHLSHLEERLSRSGCTAQSSICWGNPLDQMLRALEASRTTTGQTLLALTHEDGLVTRGLSLTALLEKTPCPTFACSNEHLRAYAGRDRPIRRVLVLHEARSGYGTPAYSVASALAARLPFGGVSLLKTSQMSPSGMIRTVQNFDLAVVAGDVHAEVAQTLISGSCPPLLFLPSPRLATLDAL